MTSNIAQDLKLEAVDEQTITQYLQQHPDLFDRHPQLLTRLRLQHPRNGTTVSLIERQVEVLREKHAALEQKLAEYIMPDIIRTGGISEMKKIATMAEAFFVPISPHDATGPITLIAGAQTMLTTPNFFRLEIAYSELEVYQQVMDPPFDVRAGYFYVSDRPGLGHELRPDYLEKAIPY